MLCVLSIQPVAERGGSDQALLRMVRSLPVSEFEVHVAVPPGPPLRAEFVGAGATLHEIAMPRISTSHGWRTWLGYALRWPGVVARLVVLARRVRADVVHTNSLHSWYGWAVALLVRRPHVWHAREIVTQSRAALAVERFLSRWFATTVVAMSGAVADQLHRAAPVRVLHELPDPDEFDPRHAGRFRATAGLDPMAPLVVFVGRIDTWKGVDVLLESWSRVIARVPDASLAVVGDPVSGKEAYAAQLVAAGPRSAGVTWFGARDDVPQVLADADVVAVPSTTAEPYGLVVVEALAAGCPVVASDAGGPREIAAFAAPGAVALVRPGDPHALADAIVDGLAARTAGPEGRRARPRLVAGTTSGTTMADILRAAARTRQRERAMRS